LGKQALFECVAIGQEKGHGCCAVVSLSIIAMFIT